MRRTAGIFWVVVFILLITATANADAQADSDANHPEYWCEEGFKIEWTGDVREYTADSDYALVVIKAGVENYTFEDVKEGDVLTVPKGISHIIFCRGTTPTSTTTTIKEEPSTTTTTVVDTTTTTTEPPTTTTEIPTTTVVPTSVGITVLPYTGYKEAVAGVGLLVLLLGLATVWALRIKPDGAEYDSFLGSNTPRQYKNGR